MKDFEITEVPSIEFIGYRVPQHEQNSYIVLFTRHQSTKVCREILVFKIFSCGFHLRNTCRLFLATPTLDVDIWTTNQNIEKMPDIFFYRYFVNNCVHLFCSCCGIRYPMNSLERASVVSTLTVSLHLLKKTLKLYFYRKPHLLSVLLIYSLLGFYSNQRTYEFFSRRTAKKVGSNLKLPNDR